MFETVFFTIAALCLAGVYVSGELHKSATGFFFALIAVLCIAVVGRFSK
jgi:hypothetical protein